MKIDLHKTPKSPRHNRNPAAPSYGKPPSPKRLLKLANRKANQTQALDLGKIDMSRPFVPEHHTQLYHTPVYERLSDEQRLLYNQLFGVRINEYIMMLERDFVEYYLVPLRRHPNITAAPDLHACLETMIEEERQHYELFVNLNRRCFPEIYAHGRERVFSDRPFNSRILVALFGKATRYLAFPLWYIMAMEESTIYLAREMVTFPTTETLGDLEPQFVSVHREHMKDEARHVQTDRHLIHACFEVQGGLMRRANSRLFKHMLRRVTRVEKNGAGLRVIEWLVKKLPELEPLQSVLTDTVMGMGTNEAYLKILFHREAMPLTFAIFDQAPEFSDLSRYMVGYDG